MSDQWREVQAQWVSQGSADTAFVGRNAAGAEMQIGSYDGKLGIGPMEMLLLGLAGCTGMDIIMILEKQRQALRDMKIQVRGKRADDFPKIYTEIEVTYQLWGENLDTRAVEQAIRLSEEKYCSVGLMLGKAAQIHSTYQIMPAEEEAKEQAPA